MQSIEDQFHCSVCLELKPDLLDSKCCHQLFCLKCIGRIKMNKCPMCRNQHFECVQSIKSQSIKNLKIECEFCKQEITLAEEANHKFSCINSPIVCSLCKKTFMLKQITSHTIQKHENMLDVIFQNFHTDGIKTTYSTTHCKEQKNEVGRLATIGTTNKYYCNGKLQGKKCSCCNGYCGPNNGQNCRSCMKLDIQRRGAPKGCLINAEGRVATFKNQKFYCGIKIYTEENIHCCQEDGQCCRRCNNLANSYLGRYDSLL